MAEYACKCLNVRMRAQPAQGSTPEVDVNEFQPIYASDSGVNIVSNEKTSDEVFICSFHR